MELLHDYYQVSVKFASQAYKDDNAVSLETAREACLAAMLRSHIEKQGE